MKKLANHKKERAYWIITAIFFAIQFIVVTLFSQRLVIELSYWVLMVPIFVFVLFVGVLLRKRIMFLLAFIWSLLLIIHALAIMIIEFHTLQLLYFVFVLIQTWCVSQIEKAE